MNTAPAAAPVTPSTIADTATVGTDTTRPITWQYNNGRVRLVAFRVRIGPRPNAVMTNAIANSCAAGSYFPKDGP